MSRPVRTRFAPSPTGNLHLGNLRVAVFNHLFARRHGGAFVVRIEDTDLERNRPGAVEGILEDLAWAGLDWDEGPDRGGGYGPYEQSRRLGLYRERASELVEGGRAYFCFCTEDRLVETRGRERDSPRCPAACDALPPGEAGARRRRGEAATVRFKVPEGPVSVQDEIRGDISFGGEDIGDFVILRRDGRATYNFAVVVDDAEMKISHVIRGVGHLSNTPKQALLFDALSADRPAFVHLPTVLAPGGGKLSKRTGAPGVKELRKEGFHPDGVVNYLSLLGWSPGDDREILTREELVSAIDLDRVGASDTAYDPEKLRWTSGRHIAAMSGDELCRRARPYVDRARYPLDGEDLCRAVEAVRTRLSTFGEVNEHLALLLPEEGILAQAREEIRREEDAPTLLLRVRSALAALDEWREDTTGEAVRAVGRELGVRGGKLFHPLRLAVSGVRSGPDLGKVLAALGRRRTLDLLDRALQAAPGAPPPPPDSV